MAGILKRSVDFFWSAMAALLIASAAVVTIVRMLLPEIGAQRENIEAWISETVGRPAVVGDIEASWRGWSPRISVSGIAFFDPSASSELVRFSRATINIAPLASLAAGTLKPQSVILSGVELTLIRHENGRFSVAGMPPPKSPIIQWLMMQNNFAVTEADLTVIDELGGSSFALSNLTVGIRNRGDRKFLNGHVDLPEGMGRSLAFDLSATGNPLETQWDGMLNIRLDGMRGSYLAQRLKWPHEATADTRIDLVAWTRWHDGRLEHAAFDADVEDAPGAADPPGIGHGLNASGRLLRHPQGWQIDIDKLEMPAVTAAPTGAGLSVVAQTRDGAVTMAALTARALPLEAVATVAAHLVPMPDPIRRAIRSGRPSGALPRLEAFWTRTGDAPPRYFAAAEFEHVSLNRSAEMPGVTGLDFKAEVNGLGGAATFERVDFKIDDDTRLADTLDVSDFHGTVAWNATGNGHRLRTRALSGMFDRTRIVLSGGADLPAGGSPDIDLAIGFAGESASRIHHLLPSGILPERGETWSRALFQSGQVRNGKAVLRGRLEDFPFGEGNGSFQVDFTVTDATLDYAQGWPLASAVSGTVGIRGGSVTFDLDRGEVEGADIAGTNVSMPDMFAEERFVRISGTARGPASAATRIVMESPLRRTRASRMREVEVDGAIAVALDMNLALFPGGPKEVLGQARFSGNRMFAPAQNLTLENVTGVITFTRRDWYGEGLTAEFNGAPVGLVFNGGLDDPNYDSEFRMTGHSEVDAIVRSLRGYSPALHAWFTSPKRIGAIKGSLPWKAVLTIPTRNGDAPLAPQRLTLESSLIGLELDMPWPLGKHAGEKKPVKIEAFVQDGIAVSTRVDLGDTLDAEITTTTSPDGSPRLERVEILFGSVTPEFKHQPGVSMRGYIPLMPLNEWAALLEGPDRINAGGITDLPVSFDVQVKDMRVLGRKLTDVRVKGTKAPAQWNISLSGFDIGGRIAIPHDLDKRVVEIELDRLHLQRVGASEDTEAVKLDLDPNRVPEVRLRCASFRFEDTEFGKTELSTSRAEHGLELGHLEFTNPDFSITAKGAWMLRDGAHSSNLDISVTSPSLTPLLKNFGYAVANIQGGSTTIAIDAGWPGTPADFSLDRISGTFELHVTDGRFLDIEPGGGRLFGLLSLQTLPRRLSLDFNDLFQKGFAFDSIDGVFEIENGNAYTNSLLMEGPSARVDVSGRIGLAEKDYDQHVVVTPALSSSIPVASALFGPIGVGAGAVYYIGQKMFKSIPEQVNKFLSREYSIKGPWESPVIERI